MKVLLTGADGQLGHELQDIVATGQAEITNELHIDNIELKTITRDDFDLTNFAALKQYIFVYNPDVTINCAAYTNVDGCETAQDNAFLINSLLPKELAILSQAINAKLVQISTDYVFSGNKNAPYQEWDVCLPQGVYGKSKYLGEQYVQKFCNKYFVVRTAWLYGYHGHNFVKTIVNAARRGQSLKVVDDQFGNPTNANDLAYHILKLMQTEQYGIYHCTNNGVCSWYDFASFFLQEAGITAEIIPCTTVEFPRTAKRPNYSALDNMMLRNSIGDEMRTWQAAIKTFIKNGLERNIFS